MANIRKNRALENTHVGTERTRTHVEPREHVTVPQPLHWIKLLFFLLPSLWRGPIPLLFWGRQLVPSGVPCLSPLDVSWSGSLAKENNTHTLTQIPPHTHTQTEKPSGIYNWQTHSRNAVEQLQSWTIAANTTSTGFSSVRQNIVDFMKDLWDYLHTFLNISCQVSR